MRVSAPSTRALTHQTFPQPITPNFFTAKARLNKEWRRKRAYLGPGGPQSRSQDIFHQLGIDPVKESLNGNLLSGYLSDMGKIQARAETGLTWRSQRRLSKAIRRAKMIGVIPLHSRRPLLRGY
jgi:small subunit ribosomal protein S18